MSDSDKRQHKRHAVEIAAEIEIRGENVAASTQNMSLGGLGLALDREVPEGSTLTVTLFLTQDGIEDPDENALEASGRVAWSGIKDAGGWLAGVRFEELEPEKQVLLERFLNKLDPG